MDADQKLMLSQKYFRGTKVKHLRNFEATTPKGNVIRGIICKKPNYFLGSMVITEVDFVNLGVTDKIEQFIQAMPKIHYYDRFHEMYVGKDIFYYPAYEKLDGSCLILYGLYYDGELVEVVPKTRGIPVADSHIVSMYNEIDHSNIESFFEQHKDVNPTLLFELFGTLNQHSIFYPKTRIDINLTGATMDGRFVDWNYLDILRDQYDFDRPTKIFSIVYYESTWKIRVMPGIFYHYLFKDCSDEQINEVLRREYPAQIDVIQAMKTMITRINKNYSEEHKRSLLEGCIINSFNFEGEEFLYLKVKSADIEERCRTENGIPRKFILKEVYKYFDEYGSEAKEIYKVDENHYKEYVNKNLLEEFDSDAVNMKRTQSRLKNVFLDMLEAKEPPKGLQDICNELKELYPNTEISDMMRIFAQEYPEKKRQASIAYDIFTKIL